MIINLVTTGYLPLAPSKAPALDISASVLHLQLFHAGDWAVGDFIYDRPAAYFVARGVDVPVFLSETWAHRERLRELRDIIRAFADVTPLPEVLSACVRAVNLARDLVTGAQPMSGAGAIQPQAMDEFLCIVDLVLTTYKRAAAREPQSQDKLLPRLLRTAGRRLADAMFCVFAVVPGFAQKKWFFDVWSTIC